MNYLKNKAVILLSILSAVSVRIGHELPNSLEKNIREATTERPSPNGLSDPNKEVNLPKEFNEKR